MTNESGIKPTGHRVLILPIEVEHESATGIILMTLTQAEREELAQTVGHVVDIGNTAWKDQAEPFAAIGDKVLFERYGGILHVGVDGKKYRIINDLSIMAVVQENKEEDK